MKSLKEMLQSKKWGAYGENCAYLTLVQEQAEGPQGDLGGSGRAEEDDCDGPCDGTVLL